MEHSIARTSGPPCDGDLFVGDDIARAARAKKGSPFLSTEQAAFYLGLSPRKLEQMRGQGGGPLFRRHSRYIRYHIDDLDDWSRGMTRSEPR